MLSQVEVFGHRPCHLRAAAPSDHSTPSATMRVRRTRRKRRGCRCIVFTFVDSPSGGCGEQVWPVGCGNSPQRPHALVCKGLVGEGLYCPLHAPKPPRSTDGGDPVAEAAFGIQLRECRQTAGLSLRQLAGRVGYDHSYLSQVERGQRPGSADLARLCDRELETGGRLSKSFEQKPARPSAPSMRSADPLESAWCGIVTAYGRTDSCAELGDFRSMPPAESLVELAADLQVLQEKSPTNSACEVAQVSALTAITLTSLGDVRTARRWWQAARTAADVSAEPTVRSAVRAREAISGLAERRPLEQLLQTADEALTLATDARRGCVLQAHAARAGVLAELGRYQEAHRALQQLIGVADELPTASTPYGPLDDWTAYEVHGAEGRVCARLGYGAAGCVLLARALELCPAEWLGERARLEMEVAECLVVDGDAAAGVALALRVLVELPDEWHSYYLYDDADRVLRAARERRPGLVALRDLEVLLQRRVYAKGRSVGSGSWRGDGRE